MFFSGAFQIFLCKISLEVAETFKGVSNLEYLRRFQFTTLPCSCYPQWLLKSKDIAVWIHWSASFKCKIQSLVQSLATLSVSYKALSKWPDHLPRWKKRDNLSAAWLPSMPSNNIAFRESCSTSPSWPTSLSPWSSTVTPCPTQGLSTRIRRAPSSPA